MIDKENFDERLANKLRKELEDYEVEYNPTDWEKLRPRLKPPIFTSIWKNNSWKPLSMAVAAALSLLIVAYAYYSNTTTPIQKSEEENTVLKEYETTENRLTDSATYTLSELYKVQSKKIDALSGNSQNKGVNDAMLERGKHQAIHAQEKITSNDVGSQVDKPFNQRKIDKNNGGLVQNKTKKNNAEKKKKQETVRDRIESIPQEKEETLAKYTPISEQKRIIFVQLIDLDSIQFEYTPTGYAKNLDLELKNIVSPKSSEYLPARMTLGMALNTLTYQNTIENTSSLEMGLLVDFPVSRKLHLIPSLLIAQQQIEFSRERSMVKETIPPNANNISTSASLPTYRNSFITKYGHSELTILNLPIDLQYDLIESEKWKIFLRGGISNYAYIVEKYKFIRNISSISTDFTLMPATHFTNYSTFTERKHQSFSRIDFFAGLNFGAGIQYAASRHFFVQAVPFYRLPMRKVAHENMEFNTYGLSLIVGYK